MKTPNYIYALAILSGILSLGGCSDDDNGNDTSSERNADQNMAPPASAVNADDQILIGPNGHLHSHGFLYTQGNEPGTNQIYIYEQIPGGDLTFFGTVASGGAGSGTSLESQGAIVLDRKAGFLYAVNAGDNTISSFAVGADGDLNLMSTVPSHGITPVSITVQSGKLYVVHAGSSSISGFDVGPGGTLTFIPQSDRQLSSPDAKPGQIKISPNGQFLYVTERATNKITRFALAGNGRPSAGISISSVGNTPFGFDFAKKRYMIVSNAENGNSGASTVTSYAGINTGDLTTLNDAVPNNQTSSCWVAISEHGYYAFISNSGTDNLASYYVPQSGNLALINENIPTGDGPVDITTASDNISVYVLCEKDQTIHSYLRTRFGNLEHTGKTPNLATNIGGLASW
jgi:6-phosphogluconolactonase